MDDLAGLDDPVLEQIGKLWTKADQAPTTRWGIVATASPLTVFLDGSIDTTGNPVAAPARSAVAGLQTGDRVWCVEQHRRVTVVQIAGAGRVYGRAAATAQSVGSSGAFSQLSLSYAGASGGVVFSSNALTVPADGLYLIEGKLRLPASTGATSLAVYINGSLTGSPILARQAMDATPSSSTYGGVETRPLEAGDSLSLRMWQNSGVTLAVDPDYTYLSVARLS